MDFVQLDVFADGAYSGNPLAVFPDAAELSTGQMQSIASEMNLSETTFVTRVSADSYDVRIFTPKIELPMAGHPTLGTAWWLRHSGRISGGEVEQRSAAGATAVTFEGDLVWLQRTGSVDQDLERSKPNLHAELADALGVDESDIGLEARELGRSGRLAPALAEAGVPMLMAPLRDLTALQRASSSGALTAFNDMGAYCFTATQAGRLRARGFFPGAGVAEDPATGVAAAALGIYLADRIGTTKVEIAQGVEMGRPSKILLDARQDHVRVGGRCVHILEGRLTRLP
ncbi:MAG: PhzF family phenazine biosynthesis protein [Actinomycetota bacterium]|nr:PhzF family phenazine biosynthesis protein [Actinomycetota bacterium]